MNPAKACVLAAFGVAALGGCKTLSVSAASANQPVYEHGSPVLRSQKKNVVEVVMLTQQFADRTDLLPAFVVRVRNGGESALVFSSENITAYSGGSRVRVYTYGELAKRIKNEAEFEASMVSMRQPIFSKGSAYVQADEGQTTSTNPSRAERYTEQARSEVGDKIAQTASFWDNQLNRTGNMVAGSVVAPGGSVGGVVVFHAKDIRSGQPLRLLVAIGGEVHEFLFDVGLKLPRFGGRG
jgi:hypothetical protein